MSYRKTDNRWDLLGQPLVDITLLQEEALQEGTPNTGEE